MHLTPEQYFAYIRYHPVVGNRRFGGLARLLASVGLTEAKAKELGLDP